jgi:SAM-dependent methyltransferase
LDATLYKQDFPCCPLCEAALDRCTTFKVADCSGHPLYKPELPAQMTWLRCGNCAHVFTQNYWTPAAERLLFAMALNHQLPGTQETEFLRNQWAPTIHRVAEILCQTRPRNQVYGGTDAKRPVWLDIGFGNGALVMTADEFGFAAIGVDVRAQAVERLQSLDYRAICADFADLTLQEPVAVLSMADVLEHVPHPRVMLAKARAMLDEDGVIYISCPNSETFTWRRWERGGKNPYWGELEHYHNFSRSKLFELLAQQGFAVVDYFVSCRYFSCLEIVARKS